MTNDAAGLPTDQFYLYTARRRPRLAAVRRDGDGLEAEEAVSMFDLRLGDCLEIMKTLPENHVSTILTDPPYGLSDHKPEDVADCLRAWLNGEAYAPKKRGFMGKAWDAWCPGPEVWRECLRVLKPGGMMLVFAGTRSMDLMSMAIRLAGFELRDSIGYAHDSGGAPLAAWTFASGFPKSANISKLLDRAAGAERETVRSPMTARTTAGKGISNELDERPWLTQARKNGYHEHAGPTPATDAARQWDGWGTALAPAWEPIILAMKPIDQNFAFNAQRWGVAGLAIDRGRIGTGGDYTTHNGGSSGSGRYNFNADEQHFNPSCEYRSTNGRWPKNAILDESAAALLDEMSGESRSIATAGGASRFFFCAKASTSERNAGLAGMEERMGPEAGGRRNMEAGKTGGYGAPRANFHPTVKPVSLLRYLCRLTSTPTGGVVLDPFMGSGSTGVAALAEDRRFIGIELEPEYFAIAQKRLERAAAQLSLFAEGESI